jgi:hypothetical protein
MRELKVDNPHPGFGLILPDDDLSPDSFRYVRAQIEFRRKCMNQGFDNLLELLAMHEAMTLKRGELSEEKA